MTGTVQQSRPGDGGESLGGRGLAGAGKVRSSWRGDRRLEGKGGKERRERQEENTINLETYSGSVTAPDPCQQPESTERKQSRGKRWSPAPRDPRGCSVDQDTYLQFFKLS